MTHDPDQDAWIARVLGILPPAAPTSATRLLLPVWRQAKDAVDAQFAQFEDALHKTGLPLGTAIAARGVASILGRDYIGFAAALFDLDGGAPEAAAKAREKLLRHSAGIRQTLAGARAVSLVEANPLGVTVTPRAILGAALDTIERDVRAART
jgi:hypothetical protein